MIRQPRAIAHAPDLSGLRAYLAQSIKYNRAHRPKGEPELKKHLELMIRYEAWLAALDAVLIAKPVEAAK